MDLIDGRSVATSDPGAPGAVLTGGMDSIDWASASGSRRGDALRPGARRRVGEAARPSSSAAVSYTHLTLPTICSV